MNLSSNLPLDTVQLFEPDPNAVYTIEAAEHIARVPRRLIAVYYKHGLVSPVVDPDCGGFYFNDEGIRALRRIEYLRTTCGLNLGGIKMVLDLTNEVERLRSDLRFLRGY
jgi:MerR family transcriptional regulator, heat shock protein HspR